MKLLIFHTDTRLKAQRSLGGRRTPFGFSLLLYLEHQNLPVPSGIGGAVGAGGDEGVQEHGGFLLLQIFLLLQVEKHQEGVVGAAGGSKSAPASRIASPPPRGRLSDSPRRKSVRRA